MKKNLFAILIALAAAFVPNASALSASPGDIDGANGVTLKDAVLSLQICAGLAASGDPAADVDGDGQIGLAEALFVLRAVASGAQPTDFSLGDDGRPDDYDQTILDMSQFLEDYDAFVDQLPMMFDWRDRGVVTPAKDQQKCGSCWAFAAVGALEAKIRIQGGDPGDLSEQQQVSCNDQMGGCSGGKADSLKFWTDFGPMTESCAGYAATETPCSNFNSCEILPHHVAKYYTVDIGNPREVKSSLYKDGPAYFRFDVYSDFMNFWQNEAQDEVYRNVSSEKLGGHAVLLIGWDDFNNAWLCKNSWGPTAGPNGDGTFWIAYEDKGHANNLEFAMSNATLTASNFRLTSPNGGEKWETGKSYAIQWEQGTSGNVKIQLYDGQTPAATIVESTANNGLYVWPVPPSLPTGDAYRIRVTDPANPANDDYSDASFSVISSLQMTTPNGGEEWRIDKTHAIEWQPGTDPGEVSLFLFRESEDTLRRLADQIPNSGSWSWTIPDTVNEGDDYKMIVRLANNTAVFDESDGFFKISYPPPPPPTNLIASDGEFPDKVEIAWDAVSGAFFYQVYRNTELNPDAAAPLTEWQSGTVYPDADAVPGQTYYYWVKAAKTVSGDGESEFSDSDSGFALACNHEIVPESQFFLSSGGTGSITVAANTTCHWTAKSNADWISIVAGASDEGGGMVEYSIKENMDISYRTGTINISGRIFTVRQIGQEKTNFVNSLGMTFRRIPAGVFTMGSPIDEPGRDDDETPHQVTITKDYYMQTTETTQAQWKAVMGSNPSKFINCGDDCPVENIGWETIQDFITTLNIMDGKTYRLPTEAEWEYAARAGSSTAFYNGDITNQGCSPLDTNLNQIGWYCGNNGVENYSDPPPPPPDIPPPPVKIRNQPRSENVSRYTTHPVAQKQPNAWGLYDMSGNVWERCHDWYNTYPEHAVSDPIGSEPMFMKSLHVIRGGAINSSGQECRSANRLYSFPPLIAPHYGFRLVVSPYDPKSCAYFLSPKRQSFPVSGGGGSITVATAPDCHWVATADKDWISIVSGNSDTGDGVINYSILENTSIYARTGTIAIADTTFTVEQAGQNTEDKITNSFFMTFRRIPAGVFLMGSPPDELGRNNDETQHQVTLTEDYFIQTTEVTRTQWEAVMGRELSFPDGCGGNCPVSDFSWDEAQEFITTLNALEGMTYRLPTEAEWEYAARAGSTTAFYNGDIVNTGCSPLDPNLHLIGWYCGNSNDVANPVAHKQPNAWGLYDMAGNVYELCQDWYDEYPTDPATDPKGPDAGDHRVVRGGCGFSFWSEFRISTASQCRSAERGSYSFNQDIDGDEGQTRPTPPQSPQFPKEIGLRLAFTPDQCNYVIAPTKRFHQYPKETDTVVISATSECRWSAISNVEWISIDSGATGVGNGVVSYSLTENVKEEKRKGTLSIAGNIFSIEQTGRIEEDEFINSIGMTFKRIPAGTFIMGSSPDEPGRSADETQHQVTLTKDYYMQTTEVTQAQWKSIMENNPSRFKSCGDDCPVETVSWNDVKDFIMLLNAMDDHTYRLPTEAEWEYAARAGAPTAFHNGEIVNTDCALDSNLDQSGWYCGNSDASYTDSHDVDWAHLGPQPVAQKQPNAWGLYDMSGNVWEWCQDWYDAYPEKAETDPTGPDTGTFQVNRGGSWFSVGARCRLASRDKNAPDHRTSNMGFRVLAIR